MIDNCKEIKLLEEKYDKLESEIWDIEYRIDELSDFMKNSKDEIDALKNRIVELSQKAKESEEELKIISKELPNKKNELESLEKEIEKQKDLHEKTYLKEYVNKVKKIDVNECYNRRLFNDTATIELLDDFSSSNKDYLILNRQFVLSNNRDKSISLIVCRRDFKLDVVRTQPTMTELKQNAGKSIRNISTSRLLPLIEKIKEIDDNHKRFKNGAIYVFEKPFLMGGQTSKNRTNYGCEWIGGGDYIENTLYGEVTDYMIVGFVIVDRYSYY